MQGFQLIESIRQQRQGFQRKQERTTSAYLRLAGSFSSDDLSKLTWKVLPLSGSLQFGGFFFQTGDFVFKSFQFFRVVSLFS